MENIKRTEPLTEEEIEGIINSKYTEKDNYTKEFIRKGILRFGDIFDYSKTVRVDNNRTKVIITCPTHGDFKIDPQYFVSSRFCKGCPECNPGKSTRKTQERFLAEISNKFPQYIATNNTKYVNNSTKIELHCTIHNTTFQITPGNLLFGKCGCKSCSQEKYKESTRKFVESKLISDINTRFPEYDTSEVHYVDQHTKITLICKHDNTRFSIFYDSISSMLYGNYNVLCPECRKKISLDLRRKKFIDKCIQRYGTDRFEFSNLVYTSNSKPIRGVICKTCGKELNIPNASNFLKFDREYFCECEHKRGSLGEINVRRWLEKNNFSFTEQYKVPDENLQGRTPKSRVIIDFRLLLDNSTEVWIEYNGEQHYNWCLTSSMGITLDKFEGQIRRDSNIRKYCSSNCIKLIEIPYTYSTTESIYKVLDEILINNIPCDKVIKIPNINYVRGNKSLKSKEEQKNEEQ